MKIVVTSDTHIKENSKTRQLPGKLLNACRSADLIIHAGDFQSPAVYNELAQYAKVKGVYGNVDGDDMKQLVRDKEIINANGRRIGIVHGHGEKKTTEKRAIEAFEHDEVDIIIFGHSHMPMIRYIGKTLLINPGSPTDKRKMPHFSFVVLEINEEVSCKMVFFS